MIEYKSNNSKEKCIELIRERTKSYEKHKLILNMDSEDDVQIQSSFKGCDFILYCNAKKMIYFAPPKAFYGTVLGDNNQAIIRGKFKLTKNCFWGLFSNCLCVFLIIVGSSLIKYTLTDFISCIIISLIFVSIIILAVEIFSCAFMSNAYKKIINFLIEISDG